MDTPRVFRVTAGSYTWTILALDGITALEKAQDLHLQAERSEYERDGWLYRGFPYSFEVESLGTIDATTQDAKDDL